MALIKPRILAIDDEDGILRAYKANLKHSYDLTLENNPLKGLELLKQYNFSLVLLDVMMPEMNGLEVLKEIKKIDSDQEVVMVTALNDVKLAVQAVKLGAYDYVPKPFERDELIAMVGRVLERKSLLQENTYLKQTLEEKSAFLDLIGTSPAMKNVFSLVEKVAPTDTTVLITGESGSGKDLVARAIHKASFRANRPFVVVNCAAIPDALIEAELFGYEKGAFTGAHEAKQGKFELATGGTLLLDEIGCMKAAMQAKLLRVLQDHSITRVGGAKPIEIDVRVISATNLDLEKAIKDREFREDLYYRLNVLPVVVPSLRDRKEDIPLLLEHFLSLFSKELNKNIKQFSPDSAALLMEYDWPGNVRELQNLVERIVVLSPDKENITIDDIPLENALLSIFKKDLKGAKEDFERRYINNVLIEAKGNQAEVARKLGLNRTTLISKLKQLGLR